MELRVKIMEKEIQHHRLQTNKIRMIINREEVLIWNRADKDLQVRMEVRLVAQEVALQIMIYNLKSHLYSPKALNELA